VNRQFSRRAFIAGSAAVGGAYLASQVRDVTTLTSRLGSVRLQTFSREPIFLAMLDRHAQRLQPLIPEIERLLNRRLQIDALPAEQLYANYTIDLLQQTGRYDVVSINDHWTPYFGRRGYLSEVGSLSDASSPVSYPPLIEAAATGIDDTPLVAYPWTIDFTCAAAQSDVVDAGPPESWSEWLESIQGDTRIVSALGLQAPRSAAEVYRTVLLSFGQEILRDDDGEPILDHYWQERSLDVISRLAKLSSGADPTSTSLERAVDLAESGEASLLPVLWASDCRRLVDSGNWRLQPLPDGRDGRRRCFVAVWRWGIPAGAPNSGKAREFVELMTGVSMQGRLWSDSSLIPAIRPAIQSAGQSWLSVRPLTFDAIDRGYLRPALRSYRAIMDIVGQSVVEAVTTGAPTSLVLAAANRKVRDVLIQEDELRGLR
jgi:ABC-type glycerol-3-phosphate transport system substrate-binding protein